LQQRQQVRLRDLFIAVGDIVAEQPFAKVAIQDFLDGAAGILLDVVMENDKTHSQLTSLRDIAFHRMLT
jgi:hypothetical protein